MRLSLSFRNTGHELLRGKELIRMIQKNVCLCVKKKRQREAKVTKC